MTTMLSEDYQALFNQLHSSKKKTMQFESFKCFNENIFSFNDEKLKPIKEKLEKSRKKEGNTKDVNPEQIRGHIISTRKSQIEKEIKENNKKLNSADLHREVVKQLIYEFIGLGVYKITSINKECLIYMFYKGPTGGNSKEMKANFANKKNWSNVPKSRIGVFNFSDINNTYTDILSKKLNQPEIEIRALKYPSFDPRSPIWKWETLNNNQKSKVKESNDSPKNQAKSKVPVKKVKHKQLEKDLFNESDNDDNNNNMDIEDNISDIKPDLTANQILELGLNKENDVTTMIRKYEKGELYGIPNLLFPENELIETVRTLGKGSAYHVFNTEPYMKALIIAHRIDDVIKNCLMSEIFKNTTVKGYDVNTPIEAIMENPEIVEILTQVSQKVVNSYLSVFVSQFENQNHNREECYKLPDSI